MTEPRIIKGRKPIRHFALRALFIDDWYFAVCGSTLPIADTKIGPRLTMRWRDVTCKRCLRSRWVGSVTGIPIRRRTK